MRNDTRKLFKSYCNTVAQLNDVESASEKFSVTPVQEQRIEEKIQESSGFLKKINMVPVDNQEGEKVGVGVGSTIASTTDTSADNERKTTDVHTTSGNNYRCEKTDFDTHLRYSTLDAWRHKPEFKQAVSNAVNKQIARDRIMIGWNGERRVENSDRVANPLLQDVNKGWLTNQVEAKAASIMAGKKVGDATGADYKNIDAMVMDVTNELLAEWYQDDPDLVVICGRGLLADKYLSLVNNYNQPTERSALDIIMSNKQIGELPAIRVPFFPAKAFAITRLDNLSIYYQTGTTRRHILDNPKKDRVEEYRSMNESYVVEDHDLFAGATGILVPGPNGTWV